jgi:hypothetical protein
MVNDRFVSTISPFGESPHYLIRASARRWHGPNPDPTPRPGAPDDVYDRVRTQLSEKELSDLTFLVMSINAWNRVNVGFQAVPGTYDKELGLDKSGLC